MVAVVLFCVLFITTSMAVRELVVITEPRPAQHVEGIVLDPSGAPIADMTVTDRTEEWVSVLRSTTTDEKGRFRFSRKSGKTLYYLRFDHPGFNPLQLKLSVDKKARERGITVNAPIGG
jgi:Carboxypeptidase regulatory-like domain